MKYIIFAALSMLVLAFTAGCDVQSQVPEQIEATAGWSPPTYGTPVEHYVLQHQVGIDAWQFVATTTDTTYTFLIPFSADSKVRVAGVDAEGRQGPWSLPSNPYNPSESMPGIPVNITLGEAQ